MAKGDTSEQLVDAEYMHYIIIVSPSLEMRSRYPVPVVYNDVLSFWIPATGSRGMDLKYMIGIFLSVMLWVAPLSLYNISQRWRPMRLVS